MTAFLFQEFDVSTVAVSELEFEEPFQLTVQRDAFCHVCKAPHLYLYAVSIL